MPPIQSIGKVRVINNHQDVRFRILDYQYDAFLLIGEPKLG